MANRRGRIRITITGPAAAGKTYFVDKLLRDALRRLGRKFVVWDGEDIWTLEKRHGEFRRKQQVEVFVTNDAAQAAAHARGE